MRQINTRQFKVVLVIVAAVACAVSIAWAQNTHFIKATASLVGTDIDVSWKEVGLGDNQNIDYEASAKATATYVCVTPLGHCLGPVNQGTVEGTVTATGTFASGKKGSITASLTLEPPNPGTFSCTGPLTMALSEVSYSNIQITDKTNNISKTATPIAISATPFVCP